MQEHIQPITTSLQAPDQIRIRKALNRLGSDQLISVEGHPLYASLPWSPAHDLAYNQVIPFVAQELQSQDVPFHHDLLFDDFTPDIAHHRYSMDFFLSQIALNLHPALNHRYYESQFATEAQELIQSVPRQRTLRIQNSLHLISDRDQPLPITTPSGRATCGVLDALFQRTKHLDHQATAAIIVHSKEFVGQQQLMRQLLLSFFGELPLTFLNIFTKNDRVSTILLTQPNGEESYVN
jgi:hypothetical protein